MVLSIEHNAQRTSERGNFLPKIEIEDYNVMIKRQNLFDQLVKNDMREHDNLKATTSHRDDYTKCCLLDYPYFKEHYKVNINRFK